MELKKRLTKINYHKGDMMSAMFHCKSCQQSYLVEGTSGELCNPCIYGTSKTNAQTIKIWDVLPTYKDYQEIDSSLSEELENTVTELKKKLEIATEALEHLSISMDLNCSDRDALLKFIVDRETVAISTLKLLEEE